MEPGQGRRSEKPSERGSIFSEVGSHASRGLEKRWGSDFDRASAVSAPVSRASSATRGGSGEDGARSSTSFSLSNSPSSRRSTSRLDSLSRAFSPSLSRASGLGRESPDSRLSLGRGYLGEWDDGASVALSEAHSQYSHPSLARSLSVPHQPRISASATDEPLGSSICPVGRHSYLDPDLEAAINEVLSYKPVPFQRSSLEPDSEEDRKSIQSARSAQPDAPERDTSIRRSASAADVSRSRSRSSRKSRGKRRSSSSSSSSSEDSSEHKRRKKGRSRKGKKKSKSRRKRTESESESSSSTSSGSTVSVHSRSSVKKGPAAGNEKAGPARRPSRKEEKKRKEEVDSLMMRYLYRPESD